MRACIAKENLSFGIFKKTKDPNLMKFKNISTNICRHLQAKMFLLCFSPRALLLKLHLLFNIISINYLLHLKAHGGSLGLISKAEFVTI